MVIKVLLLVGTALHHTDLMTPVFLFPLFESLSALTAGGARAERRTEAVHIIIACHSLFFFFLFLSTPSRPLGDFISYYTIYHLTIHRSLSAVICEVSDLLSCTTVNDEVYR